jgi:hypothetical protein
MRIATTVALIAIGFATPIAAKANTKDPLVLFSTQARVEIDSQGKVTNVTPDPTLSPAISKAIQQTVGSWQFAPPARAGRVGGGVTYLSLSACAALENGTYRLAVDLLGSGPSWKGPAPTFPAQIMRAGRSVSLRLDYRVLADGTGQIDDVVFTKGSTSSDERALRESMRKWIRASKFQPEILDGVPLVTRVSSTMNFVSEKRTYPSLSAAQSATEKGQRESAAANATCKTAMEAARGADRQIAVDSPFQLLPPG